MPPRRCARRRAARLFTGRYPQSNGLVGLAHHGWEYRADVRTLPASLSESGWYTALFGMQHETSYPSAARLRRVRRFELVLRIRRRTGHPVAHRPARAAVPAHRRLLRDAPAVSARPLRTRRRRRRGGARLPARHRRHPAGSRRVLRIDLRRRRRCRPTARHARRDGLDRTTWVVFMTDHGPALPRAKSTLYDAGTGIAMIVRPPRDAASAHGSTTNCSAASTWCRRCSNCSASTSPPISTACRTRDNLRITPQTSSRCAPRSTPRRRITIRSIRSAPSAQRNTATSRTTRRGRCSICRGISPKARPARPWRHWCSRQRPARELYDLIEDPTESHNLLGPDVTDKAEAIANDLALLLNDWRQKTNDVIPSEFAGTRIAERYTETYLQIHGPSAHQPVGDRLRTRHRGRAESRAIVFLTVIVNALLCQAI